MPLSPAQTYEWTGLVLRSLRQSLSEHGFLEILPAILSSRAEPSARHSVAVLGDRARPDLRGDDEHVTVSGRWAYYLPVSHAVEKQLSLEHAERVYCLAPCVRLLMDDEDGSGKHLYTFFQVEIEWRTSDMDEVFATAESVLGSFAARLAESLPDHAGEASRRRLTGLGAGPYPRLTFADAVEQAGRDAGASPTDDLTRAEEDRLTRRFETPFWIHHYPLGVRDSLYHLDDDGIQETYDLMLPAGHGELATGGIRPQSEKEITEQSERLGGEPNLFYASWKERTGVKTAGFGIGLERLIRFCADAESVLELRPAHDSGPNRRI